MTRKDNRSEQAAELRRQAEEIILEKTAPLPENQESIMPEEIRRQFHELRVHQIELEMQNRELCNAHAELDIAQAHYFDLYNLAPVGYCTLSEQGLILEANLTAATLLGLARANWSGSRSPGSSSMRTRPSTTSTANSSLRPVNRRRANCGW